jgi:membrane-bound lytic murein transglycosylase D
MRIRWCLNHFAIRDENQDIRTMGIAQGRRARLRPIFISLFAWTVAGCQTISNWQPTPATKPTPDKSIPAPESTEAPDQTSQTALEPIANPTRGLTELTQSYCEDNLYAQHLEKRYLADVEPRIKAIRSWRRRRQARRNLKYHIRHHVSNRIDGPHAPYFGALPVVENPRVEVWLNYFQGKGRSVFLKWLVRSKSYENLVIPLLRQEGLPPELFFMAMIESGFNNRAYSPASATGTWQFMKATARHYGLRINYWVDERRDPVKSTLAAARFLKDLYSRFGDWYLAMAAYNAGPGKVNRAIRRTGRHDFWAIAKTRYLRSETKHYVPKMLAALIIASNPERFGFHVVPDAWDITPLHSVKVTRPHRIRDISARLGVDYDLLRRWNPELLRGVTPPNHRLGGEPYPLRLPKIYAEQFSAIEPSLDQLEIKDVKMYRIRRGDTLSEIARRHNISLRKLRRMNPHIHPRRLRPGKRIAIPIPAVVVKQAKDTA